MKKNYSEFSSFFKPGLLLVVFLFFSLHVNAQRIIDVEHNLTSICQGEEIDFLFTVRNGVGGSVGFDTETVYKVEIVYTFQENNTIYYSPVASFDFTNQQGPPKQAFEERIITQSISLESDIPPRVDYQLLVTSTNPEVPARIEGITSQTFEIITNTNLVYSETEIGDDSWIGHVYDGTNQNRAFNQDFTSYVGGYTENLSFDQNFGGNQNNFQLGTGSCAPSVITEAFAVRYRMNSSFKGLYYVNIGSDDGTRLNVDGELVYNDWSNHAYRNQNILMSLSGSSNLVLDYYENGGGNRVNVDEPQLLIENILTTNLTQSLNSQNSGDAISGDEFTNLPNGISRFGNGYQWVYSTTENGETNEIPGATNPNLTPNRNIIPFDNEGIYYVYRIATLTSNNNRLGNAYTTSIKSNPAIITVENLCPEAPEIILNTPTTICSGQTNIRGTFTGTGPWNITGELNGQSFNTLINDRNFDFPLDIQENTTIEILSITDANGCENNAPDATVTINVVEINNNTISGNQEFCGSFEPEPLEGSDLGNGYNYAWEFSTTNSTQGFSPAQGNNDQRNYVPGNLTETTWYRRKVNVQNCTENISNVIEVTVSDDITNNHILFLNGNSGTINATADENQEISINAPVGTFFTYVNFASYGTPGDNNGNFIVNENCHATISQSVTESYVLGESLTTIPATNVVYTDPCVGTFKALYVTATYGQAFCKGIDPGTVAGTIVIGNNITYSWQLSTEGPSSGFAPAPGNNIQQNYNPGILNQDIWLKRIVNSGSCISESPVLYIPVLEENLWTGEENKDWNNTNNWSCNSLPTLETDVLIPENLTSGNYPEISAGTNAFAKNLTIENGASLLVTDNWLRIARNLINDGLLNTETGSISFEGTRAQIIPNSAFVNNRIQNLRVDNSSGVTSEAIIEVTGNLKVAQGILDTGDKLTLISNEIQTALIDGSGSGQVIGLVSMQRYLDKAYGYKYFSSPFQNSVVGDFSAFMDLSDPDSGFPHFYRYDENRNLEIEGSIEDATGWETYIDPDNSLNVSEGYALNFGTSSSPRTIELIGEVNNGAIFSQQLENNHREYTKGFHLIGNPYPSPIDWNAEKGWVRDNIDDGIYFFNSSEDSQYTGSYTAFVNDISTGNTNLDSSPENIIPSMQGFFVKVSDSDSESLVTGNIEMDNRVRVTNFVQEFYRTQVPVQRSLIRLEAGFQNTAQKDPMVIYFSPLSTPDFEKELDAHKLMNTDPTVPSFYTITANEKDLAINAIPYPESESYKKLKLGITADQGGKMSINLSSLENLNLDFNIYLIDHKKRIGQNLKDNPVYNFEIESGINNSRFELMFSEENITSPAIAFDDPFDVFTENGNVHVNLNLEEFQNCVIRASTITGQILDIKEATGNELVVLDGIKSEGVYIIILQVDEKRFSKKFLFKK